MLSWDMIPIYEIIVMSYFLVRKKIFNGNNGANATSSILSNVF
jgi:hypothetical protein